MKRDKRPKLRKMTTPRVRLVAVSPLGSRRVIKFYRCTNVAFKVLTNGFLK